MRNNRNNVIFSSEGFVKFYSLLLKHLNFFMLYFINRNDDLPILPIKIRDKGGFCKGRQEEEGSSRVKASIKWNKAGISRGRKGKEGEGRYEHCRVNSGTSRGSRGEQI